MKSKSIDNVPVTRSAIMGLATKFNVYAMMTIALCGAVLFFIGLLTGGVEFLDDLPESVSFVVVGMFGFSLFFPLFMALYFARHVLLSVARVESELHELRERIESAEGHAPEGHDGAGRPDRDCSGTALETKDTGDGDKSVSNESQRLTLLWLPRQILLHLRTLIRSRRSLLVSMYSVLAGNSQPTSVSLEDARDAFVAARGPDYPVDTLPRLERQHVRASRLMAMWMLSWLLLVPAVTTGILGYVCWPRASPNGVREYCLALLFGCGVFFVSALVSLVIQGWFLQSFLARISCPATGFQPQGQGEEKQEAPLGDNCGEDVDGSGGSRYG